MIEYMKSFSAAAAYPRPVGRRQRACLWKLTAWLFWGIVTLASRPSVAADSGKLPRPSHIVVVIEENKSFADVVGTSKAPFPHAPYLGKLAKKGALLTQYHALHHPSQPNYIEIFSGSNQGLVDDCCPLQACQPQQPCNHPDELCSTDSTSPAVFPGPSLGGLLIQKGLSFTGYAESLPEDIWACCNQHFYARKHCPWLDFKDVPATNPDGSGTTKDFTAFNTDMTGGKLPTVSFVIPNLIHDMHSLPGPHPPDNNDTDKQLISAGDQWLKENMDAYVTWAMKNNGLLVVTWDENDDACDTTPCSTFPPANHIPTILVGPMVRPGSRSSRLYSHYSLLRTILDMYELKRIGGSQQALPIDDIWR